MLRETFKGEGPPGPDGADRKFFEALKAMSQDLASKREIVSLDIQNAAEQALGGVGPDDLEYAVDLDWLFDQRIRGAGIPQFSFQYQTRETEDGSWIVEGSVEQRVVVGNKAKFDVLTGRFYRGRTSITVVGKDGKEYPYNLIVDSQTQDFALKVPVEPREVVLNKGGEMLTLDPVVGRSF